MDNPIGQILKKFKAQALASHAFNPVEHKVLRLLPMCRTSKLGSHVEKCNACHFKKIHYNSCGNRHCPNCQGLKKEKWIDDRYYDLLPVKYFHGVFTVPSELNILIKYNKKLLYNLLFRCVKETLFEFGLDERQKLEAKMGAICILHTWNQQLQFHPHIHCIIPAGGLDKNGQWKETKGKKDFLFSVKALSSKFKKKFLINLVGLYKDNLLKIPKHALLWHTQSDFYQTKSKLYNKSWVVYAKESFGGPQQVFEYLGRYTHRIAISNQRIVSVDETFVTFKYLDRKNNASKTKKIKGEDFIKLFLQHVLPPRFTKVRHFGFLSSRSKKSDLALIRKALNAHNPGLKVKLSTRAFVIKTKGIDPYICTQCKKGEMVVIDYTPSIRGSPRRFAKDKIIKLEGLRQWI